MKVALIGPVYPYRGGIAHHTLMLADRLAKNHQVTTISFRRQYPSIFYPGRSDRDPSSTTHNMPVQYLIDPIYPWTWWHTSEFLRRLGPEVVVFQWWTTFWSIAFGTLARRIRRNGSRVIYLIHNVLPHEPVAIDRPLARYALCAGDLYICQSERERGQLVSLLPDARVKVCHLPVYDLFNASRVTKPDARLRLQLPASLPLALFFGLVRPYKGLKFLIDALALLRNQGCQIGLVIAGEFWEPEQDYRKQIEALSLCDRVFIYNRYIPDELLGYFFSSADLFVAPYVQGTQSAAVKLAIGFGLPTVLTTPISDLGPSATAARLVVVPPADSQALADAIRLVLTRPVEPCDEDVSTGWDTLLGEIEGAAGAATEAPAE